MDAIFEAYYIGTNPNPELILAQIPQADETRGENNLDITPLFYWDAKTNKLLRRKQINDPYDNKMTDNWWGWSTFLELKLFYGTTPETKAMEAALEKQQQIT